MTDWSIMIGSTMICTALSFISVVFAPLLMRIATALEEIARGEK